MKTRLKHILVILLIALLIGASWSEARRGSQYKLGMSLAEVRALNSNKYPITPFSESYANQPTEQQMSHDELYYMVDDDSGVILYFNYHQVVIRKMRIKFFGVNLPKFVDSLRLKWAKLCGA
jgi:hypothetical protein